MLPYTSVYHKSIHVDEGLYGQMLPLTPREVNSLQFFTRPASYLLFICCAAEAESVLLYRWRGVGLLLPRTLGWARVCWAPWACKASKAYVHGPGVATAGACTVAMQRHIVMSQGSHLGPPYVHTHWMINTVLNIVRAETIGLSKHTDARPIGGRHAP